MLEGMDAVDWSALSHAYGPADDLPETLQAVASGTLLAQDAAAEFWGSICHQGTVYQATSHAVPFLIELLAAGTVSDQEWLLLLLASMAVGNSYRYVHGNGLLREDAQQFEQMKRQELGWAVDTHAAVGVGIPLYLTLLGDVKPEVRTAAAHTLAQFPERAQGITPTLEGAVPQEVDADTEASLLLCLEALGGITPALAHHLTRRLSPMTEPGLRLTAALILARRAGPDTPPPVIDVLTDSMTRAEAVPKSYAFSVWDKEPTEEICAAFWGVGETFAVPILLGLLPQVGGHLAAYPVVDILMERMFSQK